MALAMLEMTLNIETDTQESNGLVTLSAPAVLTHDKRLAETFLKQLDPSTDLFTFQFFSEDRTRKYAEIFHGTLDEAWRKAVCLNTSGE